MASGLLLPHFSLPFTTLAFRSIPTRSHPDSAPLRLISRRGPCKTPAAHSSSTTPLRPSLVIPDRLRREIDSFDPRIPLDEAHTPPSSWYTDPMFLDVEFDRVFYRGWQAVGEPPSPLLSFRPSRSSGRCLPFLSMFVICSVDLTNRLY